MVDIARPASVKRRRRSAAAFTRAVGLLVIVLITVGVSRLKPAAPGVDRATVWIDTVKRGAMTASGPRLGHAGARKTSDGFRRRRRDASSGSCCGPARPSSPTRSSSS